jgi:hypothetical protein
MSRNTRVAVLVLVALSGAIGSIGYQATHAGSVRQAIAGAAKGAQDRIRTLVQGLEQLAADDSARAADAAAWLLILPPDTLPQYRATTLDVTDRYGQSYAAAWRSSDPAVLAVDAEGRAEARAPGTATLTAETRDGRRLRATIVVTPPPPD